MFEAIKFGPKDASPTSNAQLKQIALPTKRVDQLEVLFGPLQSLFPTTVSLHPRPEGLHPGEPVFFPPESCFFFFVRVHWDVLIGADNPGLDFEL